MTTLKINYRLKDFDALADACQKFENLRLDKYKNVNEYVSAFRKSIEILITLNITLSEIYLINKFIINLNFSFTYFRIFFT